MKEKNDVEIARKFLDFMVDYYALMRRHTGETTEYKRNSHGFSMLYTLRGYRNQSITMTKFANEMGITKQQLTKLVNDLEEKGYVERSLNKENRRQVYISITEEGLAHLDKMIGELAHETLITLSAFSDEEKERIYCCTAELSALFKKDAELFRMKNETK